MFGHGMERTLQSNKPDFGGQTCFGTVWIACVSVPQNYLAELFPQIYNVGWVIHVTHTTHILKDFKILTSSSQVIIATDGRKIS